MTNINFSKHWIEMNGMNIYPRIKSPSRLKLNYRDLKNERVQESFEKRNIHSQLFHAVQNELIDYLRSVNPNLWPIYINQPDPSTLLTIVHEAARSRRPDLLEFILSKRPDINKMSFKNYTPLHLAVKSGNLDCVTLICREKKLDIDSQDRKGQTAIDLACRLNMIEIVKVLIKYGANVMKQEFDGMSCLHHPMRINNLEMIELLLNVQCKADVKDNNGITPIILAVIHGFADAFSLCVKSINDSRGNLVSILNSVDSEGYSCLLNAVRYKHKEIFSMCIKFGADVNIRQTEGKNAMHVASEIDWIDIIPILYEHGIDINSVDNDLDTALHLAINNGNIAMIECLIKNGAKVNICNRDLLTPLLATATLFLNLGNDKFQLIVDMLIKNNANVLIKNKIKHNILHILISDCQIEPIKYLFQIIPKEDKEKLLNSPDENGDYPLHIACTLGLEKVCFYLVNEGADIIVTNNTGSLPIHEATKKGSLEIVKFLLDKNDCQIGLRNEDEANLIQIAAQSSHYDIFEYLFLKGIDVHSKDENGNNILICACQKGHIKMVQLILTKDFTINMKNYHHSSPLHIAAYAGETEMVEYLLELGAELTENIYEQTALTLALDYQRWTTARIFLNDKNWKKTMDFRFKNGKNHLHYLIIKNEDIAYEFLNRGLRTITTHNLINCCVLKYQLSLLDLGPNDSSSANNRFHELITMADYKREKLMMHPLSIMLLCRKWSRFGNYTWAIDFIFYMLYFVLLNFLIFHFTPPTNNTEHFNSQGCAIDNSTKTKLKQLKHYELTIELLLFAVLLLRLFIEFVKMYCQKFNYFTDLDNYRFLLLYMLTLPFIFNYHTPPCQAQWSIAPILLVLLWMIPMYYVQNLHILGIPILMLKHVFFSMMRILLLFLNLLIGFTLAFYIVNENQMPFQNVPYAFMKSLMMLTGEIEYVSYFLDPVTSGFTVVKLVLISTFAILMTITMMNLMIGMAVGDIDRIMEEAKMNMTIVQIKYLSEIESIMTKRMQSYFYEPVHFRIERKGVYGMDDLIRSIYGLEESKGHVVSAPESSDVDLQQIDKRLQSVEALLQRTLSHLSTK